MFESSMVCIDIGSHSIKIAEFSGAFEKKLTNLGVKYIPQGLVQSGKINDLKMVEKYFLDLLSEMGVRRIFRRACLSLSGSNIILKRMKITPNESMDSGDQIYLEAERQLQMDMNELYFDFHIDMETKTDLEETVLVAVTKRESLNEYISMLNSAGIAIGVVDCESFALTNIVEYNFGKIPGLLAIVNMGITSTNVIFLSDGLYAYSREIGMGGENYTRAIADASGVSMDIAEHYKIRMNLGQLEVTKEMVDALTPMHEQFLNEFLLTKDFFFQSGEAPIDKGDIRGVFLTGGGSLVSGMLPYLQSKLEVPVSYLNPFQNMQIARKARWIENGNLSTSFSVLAGLSLRKVQEERDY